MKNNDIQGATDRLGISGVSLRGISHRHNGVCCQDDWTARRVKKLSVWKGADGADKLFINKEFVVAAVADGLGSVSHSDIGAQTAVKVAVSTMCDLLGTFGPTSEFVFERKMETFIEAAMIEANNAVVAKAESMGEPACKFDATLVLAVYDGERLFYGSVGDSGVIAKKDGKFELVSTPERVGESGVFPLCFKDHWEIGMASNVNGLLLATDGILEMLAPHLDNSKLDNDIIGIFMEDMAAASLGSDEMLEFKTRDLLEGALKQGATFDDATLVTIVNWDAVAQELVNSGKKQNCKPKPNAAGEPVASESAVESVAPEPVPVPDAPAVVEEPEPAVVPEPVTSPDLVTVPEPVAEPESAPELEPPSEPVTMLATPQEPAPAPEPAPDAQTSSDDLDATVVFNANEPLPCFELPYALQNFMDANGFNIHEIADAVRTIAVSYPYPVKAHKSGGAHAADHTANE